MSQPTTDADVIGTSRPVREQDRRPADPRPPRPSPGSTLVGLLVGVALLGVVVAFGVVLPRVAGEEAALPGALPDELSGGWTLIEVVEERGEGPEGIEGATEAVEKSRDLLAEVYEEAPLLGAYVGDEPGSGFITVVLFASDGGAFVQDGLPNPDRPDVALVRVDDAICLEYRDPNAGAGSAPTYSSCQVSADGRTVQVGGNGQAPEDLVPVGHEVLEDAQDQ